MTRDQNKAQMVGLGKALAVVRNLKQSALLPMMMTGAADELANAKLAAYREAETGIETLMKELEEVEDDVRRGNKGN